MNSTLGSVVPLAMFFHLYAGKAEILMKQSNIVSNIAGNKQEQLLSLQRKLARLYEKKPKRIE